MAEHSRRVKIGNAETMHKHLVAFLFAILLVHQTIRTASGAPASSGASAKEKAAKKACLTGNVKVGTEILADLYISSGDPTHIFNQGRCYEQNHRWEDAVDRFREYLRKVPGLVDKEKAEVNAHIAECESLLAKQNGSPLPLAPESSPRAVVVPSSQAASTEQPSAAPASPLVAAAAAQSSPSESEGRRLRIAGIAGTAFGFCALTTGAVLAFKEQALTNEINAKFNANKESTRASYETWGYVSYGVGAAAIITGAALYYLGWRSERTTSGTTGIALLPGIGPCSASMVLQGRF